jgi:molybdate transport system substrate-binding protein
MNRRRTLRWLWLAASIVTAFAARAESATVAVAANFVKPLETLKARFERDTPHRLVLASGSTGQLYAQIASGAPFDVLLAADREHVRRTVEAGLGEGETAFTYAIGRLALFAHDAARAPLSMSKLGMQDYRWLAIANPALAPYGAAAEQALRALGMWQSLQPRIVRGQSVAQTFAMAATGNADYALVALSQAMAYEGAAAYMEVPADLYEPIGQDAVLLRHGKDNAAARAFLDFLRGSAASGVIREFGYGAGESTR